MSARLAADARYDVVGRRTYSISSWREGRTTVRLASQQMVTPFGPVTAP